MSNQPNKIDDGGPAWPTPSVLDYAGQDGFAELGQTGMSVRMWLAGQAMKGLLSNPNPLFVALSSHELAVHALDYADDLLEEYNEPYVD